ncbi:hypothetical protein VKT23_016422 [Stygiomarasmius scandens]|uniref:Uncharacterized protein n=1 Tax=Marasmiellus scandens TaxID=2682957 RepID=A0ABR1IV10_9AGAR
MKYAMGAALSHVKLLLIQQPQPSQPPQTLQQPPQQPWQQQHFLLEQMATVIESATSNTSGPNTSQSSVELYEIRYGGYPISREVALEWANRIRIASGKKLLTAKPVDSAKILLTLDDVVVEAGGVSCNFHGLRKPGELVYPEYIIVTTQGMGSFYRVNGKMEPGSYLVEGEVEELGKELLKKEGIPHGSFTTMFA